MSDIDDKIREALGKEDLELLKRMEAEPAMHEQLLQTFRGRNRWMVIGVWFAMFAFLGFIVYAAVRFFEADGTKEMLAWAIGFLYGTLCIIAMKIWYWMELNKNIVTREVKRLELQVAALARKSD